MNLINRLERWGDAHHPKWLDVIRIVLGIFLILKGMEYVKNMDQLGAIISNSGFLGALSTGFNRTLCCFCTYCRWLTDQLSVYSQGLPAWYNYPFCLVL